MLLKPKPVTVYMFPVTLSKHYSKSLMLFSRKYFLKWWQLHDISQVQYNKFGQHWLCNCSDKHFKNPHISSHILSFLVKVLQVIFPQMQCLSLCGFKRHSYLNKALWKRCRCWWTKVRLEVTFSEQGVSTRMWFTTGGSLQFHLREADCASPNID